MGAGLFEGGPWPEPWGHSQRRQESWTGSYVEALGAFQESRKAFRILKVVTCGVGETPFPRHPPDSPDPDSLPWGRRGAALTQDSEALAIERD